jgi:uncharacterized protein YjcR
VAKRQEHLRQMAWAEYLKIRSATRVAENLGIPPTTVRSWIRDYKQMNNELPPTLRYQNEMTWREQTERIKKESTSDIHVNHYGKPPAGRSALDQKQKEQSNDERKANPYNINRYYRKPC